MSGGVQTTYAELAEVLTNLPFLLRESRRARSLSLRSAADQIGTNFNTLARVERGEDCHLGSAVAIVRWLGARP